MNFDAFLETAWADHGDRPQEVADRLAASLHRVETPEQVAPFARLLAHVLGEHLGQFDRGVALLQALRGAPACADDGAAQAVAQRIATLRHADGDSSGLLALPAEARICALADAASMLSGRGAFKAAIAAYAEATRLAAAGVGPGSPANRALAVGGNNLAAALETKADRTAAETEGMIAAAEGGLKFWKVAGTWLEEERAEYRLARTMLQAGRPAAALACAERCVAVCEASAAPAFERFFGYALLAVAQRASGDVDGFGIARRNALHCYEQVPPDERHWCSVELGEIGA
jgi:hypothetical protein